MDIPITIIGGGVIGLSLANTMGDGCCVIEKSPSLLSDKQSTRSSGVWHAGIYYPKDVMPLKAFHCVRGNKMGYDFFDEHNVAYMMSGKLVVAREEIDRRYLDHVKKVARENHIKFSLIPGNKIKDYEPNVSGLEALLFPTSGVVDAIDYMKKLHRLGKKKGAEYVVGHEVVGIRPKGTGFEVTTRSRGSYETFETQKIINCAGLYADVVAELVHKKDKNDIIPLRYEIEPLRGESVVFDSVGEVYMNGMNVYPTPYGIYPDGEKAEVSFEEFQRLFDSGEVIKTVGIHLTPKIEKYNGVVHFAEQITVGPAQVGEIGKEDYSNSREKQYFLDRVSGFFEHLSIGQLDYNQVGIQAKVKDQKDFIFEHDPKYPNLLNIIADSPGLTASPSLAFDGADYITHC